MEYVGLGGRLVEDGEDVFFADDEEVFVGDFDFGASPGGEDDAISFGDLHGGAGAVGKEPAVADAEHATLRWFLLGCIGQDDTADRFRFARQTFNNHFVAYRNDTHGTGIPSSVVAGAIDRFGESRRLSIVTRAGLGCKHHLS